MNTTIRKYENIKELLSAIESIPPTERSKLEEYAVELHRQPARRNEAVELCRTTFVVATQKQVMFDEAKRNGAPKHLLDSARAEIDEGLANANAMVEALRLNGYYFWN